MFGKRREVMSQEPKEPTNQEKQSPPAPASSTRPAKREVELFPPIAERNLSSPPVATVTSGGRLGTQISMFQPATFEEALDVVEALRSRNATTISLDKLKKTDANRLVDFVAGASAALDGDFHKMTEQVFVFCPANIKIVASGKTSTTSSAQRGTASAIATTSPGVGSSFSLDTLFPDMSQDKYGGGNGMSSLWGKQ
mgnify:CR=1 FL=1